MTGLKPFHFASILESENSINTRKWEHLFSSSHGLCRVWLQTDEVLASAAVTISKIAVIYMHGWYHQGAGLQHHVWAVWPINCHVLLPQQAHHDWPCTRKKNRINWALKDEQEFIETVENTYWKKVWAKYLWLLPKIIQQRTAAAALVFILEIIWVYRLRAAIFLNSVIGYWVVLLLCWELC